MYTVKLVNWFQNDNNIKQREQCTKTKYETVYRVTHKGFNDDLAQTL